MSGVKDILVARRMEIDDPNDPRVRAEVSRLLCINQRRLVVVLSHPNSGGFWVGKLGTEREIQEYLKKMEAEGDLDYIFAIAELKEGVEDEVADWIEFDGVEPQCLQEVKIGASPRGTPPLPGLEKRLAGIQAKAYGQKRSVWSILQALTDDQIAETFGQVLTDVLQYGLELPEPEVEPCQSKM